MKNLQFFSEISHQRELKPQITCGQSVEVHKHNLYFPLDTPTITIQDKFIIGVWIMSRNYGVGHNKGYWYHISITYTEKT